MPHDIYLTAQDNKYSSSYLPLIEKIKQHFPKFQQKFHDLEVLEEVFDGRFCTKKYTRQEIIQKGLGIKLEAEFYEELSEKSTVQKSKSGIIFKVRTEDWIEISFWDLGRINLEVPNYPNREMSVMIADIISVINFLEQEGFALEHPTEDKIILKSEIENFLYQNYVKRQILVDKGRKIVNE